MKSYNFISLIWKEETGYVSKYLELGVAKEHLAGTPISSKVWVLNCTKSSHSL